MAEKKLTKKFGQKRDFKSEEKKTKNNTYMKKKTYKEPVKKQQKTTDEKCEPKKVASKKTENHSVRCTENVADVSFWICLMRSN